MPLLVRGNKFSHASCGRCELGRAIRLAVEDEAIGVVPQAVERGRGEQAVGREGLIPFREVEVAGDERRGLLVALGDQVVEVLVGRWPQGLEAEVVDHEERDAGERGELALVGADGAGGVQARATAKGQPPSCVRLEPLVRFIFRLYRTVFRLCLQLQLCRRSLCLLIYLRRVDYLCSYM